MADTTRAYPQYPRSNFPEQVDDFATMQDPSSHQMSIIAQYEALIEDGNITGAAALLDQYPELDKSLFNAQKFNHLSDGLKATQQFFKDEVEEYVTELFQHTVGINDSPTTDDEAKTNAYSAYRIDELFNRVVVNLPVANWTTSPPYSQRVAIPGMKETDEPRKNLYTPKELSEQQTKYNTKYASMITDGDSEDGFMTFYCGIKKPAHDFQIILEGVSKNG